MMLENKKMESKNENKRRGEQSIKSFFHRIGKNQMTLNESVNLKQAFIKLNCENEKIEPISFFYSYFYQGNLLSEFHLLIFLLFQDIHRILKSPMNNYDFYYFLNFFYYNQSYFFQIMSLLIQESSQISGTSSFEKLPKLFKFTSQRFYGKNLIGKLNLLAISRQLDIHYPSYHQMQLQKVDTVWIIEKREKIADRYEASYQCCVYLLSNQIMISMGQNIHRDNLYEQILKVNFALGFEGKLIIKSKNCICFHNILNPQNISLQAIRTKVVLLKFTKMLLSSSSSQAFSSEMHEQGVIFGEIGRNTQVPPFQITNKTEKQTIYQPNIKILNDDAQVQDMNCRYSSNYCDVKLVKVSAEVLPTIFAEQSIFFENKSVKIQKKKMVQKSNSSVKIKIDKKIINKLKYQADNLYRQRQTLSHRNLANVYLRKKKQNYQAKNVDYEVESQIYSDLYKQGLMACTRFSNSSNQKFKKKVKYSLQIMNALCHMYSRKIVHNDIKLSNIMITKKDEVKIIDYGGLTNLGSLQGKYEQRKRHFQQSQSIIDSMIQQRKLFSTPSYTYEVITESHLFNPNFDMFGLGHVLKELFKFRILQSIRGSNFQKSLEYISQVIKNCQDSSSQVNLLSLRKFFIDNIVQRN